MTVPAVLPSCSTRRAETAQPTLPIPETRLTSRAMSTLLTAALDADIAPPAYRVFTAMVVCLPAGQRVTVEQIAEAARLTHHGARRLVGLLVDAGLVERHGPRVIDGRERYLYAIRPPRRTAAADPIATPTPEESPLTQP